MLVARAGVGVGELAARGQAIRAAAAAAAASR